MRCKSLSGTDDSFAILQLEEHTPELFLSIKELQRQGKAPDLARYNLVYSGPLAKGENLSQTEMLEALYMKFNISIPEDFQGHSLSVSDIVILKKAGNLSAHYVDRFGFTELEFPTELKIKEETK